MSRPASQVNSQKRSPLTDDAQATPLVDIPLSKDLDKNRLRLGENLATGLPEFPSPSISLKGFRSMLDHKVWGMGGSRSTRLCGAKEVKNIEESMSRTCARHVPEPQRSINICEALEELVHMYPSLSGIVLTTRRYIRELTTSIESLRESHRLEISDLEKTVYEKFEGFFEHKILQLLRENRRCEAVVKQLREEVSLLRKERDEDLMEAKGHVMARLDDCARKEDEFNALRKLVSHVFMTNEHLVNQVEDLCALLKKHRIEIPRLDEALFHYSKAKTSNSANQGSAEGVKKLHEQVSPEFIEASRREMHLSRLTLQRELLNSAFDDCSAYRLQISALRHENNNLQSHVTTLQGRVVELEKYIYHKRFLISEHTGDSENVPLTPRPRDVPFALQTDLGIDMKNSTARIVAELSATAINLKHQLNSALMAVRRLSTTMDWMTEESMVKVMEDRDVWGVIPVFSTSMWPNIPHFLRTHVDSTVPNLNWTEEDVSFLLHNFFTNFQSNRMLCRKVRDAKMIIPRILQLSERCSYPMVRIDATVSEVEESEENVPFGYVVSYFITRLIISSAKDVAHSSVLQSGTLNPVFMHGGKPTPVELEFSKLSYNLWHSAQRYKDTQPLCHLFVSIVDGRLPVQLFEVTNDVLRSAENAVRKADTDGSNTFTYNKLSTSVLKLVTDMDGQVGRCAALAVAETFKANDVSLVGGRIHIQDVLADELFVGRGDNHSGARRSSSIGGPLMKNDSVHQCNLKGASVLTRFWRKLAIQRHERVYDLIESVLGPLVVESQVVSGVFLLPVPCAINAIREYDDNKEKPSVEFLMRRCSFLPLPSACRAAPSDVVPDTPSFSSEHRSLRVEKAAQLSAFKDISLEGVVHDVLGRVQKISSMLHFPDVPLQEDPLEAEVTSPTDVTSPKLEQPGTKFGRSRKGPATSRSKRTKGKSRSKESVKTEPEASQSNEAFGTKSMSRTVKEPESLPLEVVLATAKEMTEWYGFCLALRQTLFSLPQTVFSGGKVRQHDTQLSPSPIVSSRVESAVEKTEEVEE
ncbi:hypothetical protein TRVL_06465 [Trypanosoma vivax]|nr:hypothetical protein TRVL_06465 [Trypanosoma vivax]